MGLVTTIQGARTALTSTGFSTLAASTYVATSAYNADTNKPQDLIIEVEAATTGTPGGNKQILVYLQASLNGTDYQSGPTSGTSTVDELNLTHIGTLPMNSVTTTQRRAFSVASVIGYVPKNFKVVLKNELGVALTSGAVYTAEISSSVA